MWVGGAGLMFAIMMTVFFAWTRETRSDGGLGWLETARRTNFATVVGTDQEAGAGTSQDRRPGWRQSAVPRVSMTTSTWPPTTTTSPAQQAARPLSPPHLTAWVQGHPLHGAGKFRSADS
jgi:hypothetical protein